MYEELLIPIEDIGFVKSPDTESRTKWINPSGEIALYKHAGDPPSWSWLLSLQTQKVLTAKNLKTLDILYDAGLHKGFPSRKEAFKNCLEVLTDFIPNHTVSKNEKFINLGSSYLFQTPGYLDYFNQYKYTGIFLGSSKRGWRFRPGDEMSTDLRMLNSGLTRYKTFPSRKQILGLIYDMLIQNLNILYKEDLYHQAKAVLVGEEENKGTSCLYKAWWTMFTRPEVDLTTVF